MGISMNGPSGIDTQSLIDQLVKLEQNARVAPVQKHKDKDHVKLDAYSKFSSYLSDVNTKAKALNDISDFNIYKSVSSDDSVATITGDTGATEGHYAIKVFQLAQAEKLISKTGIITSQSASLSSLGIGVGTISIDGTNITVDAGDTIQDLRMKINSATDSNGAKLNVTASVLKVADGNYRLVLTAKNPGAKGVNYTDVTGTTLEDLGIIVNAGGDKGTTNQSVRTTSAFAAPSAGQIVTLTGTDHNGNAISTSLVASGANPPADLLSQIVDAFHGMVDASIDGNGRLVITDKTGGKSSLSISAITVNGTTAATELAVAGRTGASVLSAGQDSYFSIDNIHLTASTNSVSSVIPGVTVILHKIQADSEVGLDLTRDTDAIRQKVTDLLNSYNALLDYTRTATKVGNPNDANDTSGDLAGDMTVTSIVSQLRNSLMTSFAQYGGTYTSLTAIGVKSDPKTGALSLDQDKFKTAIETNFDEVARLFVQGGYSSNNSVQYGRSTNDTVVGQYTLEEADPTHLRIQLQGDATWYLSDARVDESVYFSNGPANGLSLLAPAGSLNGGSAPFNFVKGIGVLASDLISKLTDPQDGIVTVQQKTLQDDMTSKQQRIDQLNDRIATYQQQLIKQFAAMEQAIAQIKSQGTSLNRFTASSSN